MFDPKSADAFKSIKAPNRLQERVLKAQPKRRTFYPVFGTAVAAGLVAVFLAVQFFSATPIGVTVGGLAVENQAVLLPNESVPMMARTHMLVPPHQRCFCCSMSSPRSYVSMCSISVVQYNT